MKVNFRYSYTATDLSKIIKKTYKNMKLYSLLKRLTKNKNNQSRKWLAMIFILVFCLSSVGFTQLGLAQEETAASSTPDVSLPIISPTDNANSTSPAASTTPDSNVSSTPATICGNGLIEEGEQCDDGNLNDNDGCNSTCKKEIIVPDDVATGLDLNLTGNERPVVQAVWQMNQAASSSDQGQDDSLADGAQFMPSGQYQVDKIVEVCAVVSDPDGLADLANVSSQVYYPKNIYLGPNRSFSQQGCGKPKEEWFIMSALESSQGLDLFCQQLRNKNANLPSFKTGYDFTTLCGTDGDLTKEISQIFCGQNRMAYQDPAGDYQVKTVALDQKQTSGVLENSFKYLELVAFEIDFNNIEYGSIELNSPKVLAGNETFLANDGRPTLRNIGNTRLEIAIKQNDMGLGRQSETGWNLTYQARVGKDANFTNYWPETWATLANSMNLEQTSQLDLAVEVLKFPEASAGEHYVGKLFLNATAAPQLMCAE